MQGRLSLVWPEYWTMLGPVRPVTKTVQRCRDHCHCPTPAYFVRQKGYRPPVPTHRGYLKPSHFFVIMCIYLVLPY